MVEQDQVKEIHGTPAELPDFDRLLTDGSIRMGLLVGSKTLLFIKTGQGGTIYGDENKYLRLAEWVREKYGFSVISSATELDKRDIFDTEMEWVRKLLPDSDGPIYYLGVSKGGLIGCWYGAEEPRIRRVLAINAPLMINFQNRTVPAMEKLTAERLTMVYGTLDPSYSYVPFIARRTTLKILDGADHNLQDYPVSLAEIVEKWLLFDAK